MAEHTSGPWSVGRTRQSVTDPSIGPFWEVPVHAGESKNRGNVLATAYMGGKGAIDMSREAVEANARLISAAPDLLDACLGMLMYVDDVLDDDDDDLMHRRAALIAAIFKATGATP